MSGYIQPHDANPEQGIFQVVVEYSEEAVGRLHSNCLKS
jgi:hypothetical protein